jgi:hypothetical protein
MRGRIVVPHDARFVVTTAIRGALARGTTTPVTSTPSPPPSSTREEPTATLVLAPDPIVGTILNALQRTDAATSYRIQMDATASGSLASAINNQNSAVLLNVTGESVGADSHVVMKGIAMSKLTSDSARSIELTTVGGKNFVKGPLPLLGAKENKWYVLPSSQSLFRESPSGLSSVFGTSLGASRLVKAAAEKLDGRTCDVYAGDKNAAIAAFANLAGESRMSSSERAQLTSSVASAEFKFWVCDDGYLHQVRIGFEGTDPRRPSERFGFKLMVRTFDFGGKISITAPVNAIAATPLIDLNELFAPTPTPFRVPTFGIPAYTPFALPAFTPFATYAFPLTPFKPFPTFSIPFTFNPTP